MTNETVPAVAPRYQQLKSLMKKQSNTHSTGSKLVKEKSSFKVTIGLEDFIKGRLVFGPIWLEADSESFPGKGWTDFPVVILGFWLTNLRPVVQGSSQKCECPFMDGPYRFDVQVAGLNEWTLDFVERTAHDKRILLAATLDASVVLSQIQAAARAVVDLCRNREWVDADLIRLEELLRQKSEF